MSLTAASVKVADARQYLAFGNAAENQFQRSGLEKFNTGVMMVITIIPIRQKPSPTLLHITVHNL